MVSYQRIIRTIEYCSRETPYVIILDELHGAELKNESVLVTAEKSIPQPYRNASWKLKVLQVALFQSIEKIYLGQR